MPATQKLEGTRQEFADHTTEQLEETLRCMNYLYNMEFIGNPFDQKTFEFYQRVEKELAERKTD